MMVWILYNNVEWTLDEKKMYPCWQMRAHEFDDRFDGRLSQSWCKDQLDLGNQQSFILDYLR